MNKEETEYLPTLAERVLEVQKNAPVISHDAKVEFGKTNYSYASLPHIWEQVKGLLYEHGILVMWSTRADTNMLQMGVQGIGLDNIDGSSMPLNFEQDPKKLGAEITYKKRQMFCAYFGLMTEGDNDAMGVADDKPAATDAQIAKAIEKIMTGQDENIIEKMRGAFTLSVPQLRRLFNAENIADE